MFGDKSEFTLGSVIICIQLVSKFLFGLKNVNTQLGILQK
jgi:hypothetical protein